MDKTKDHQMNFKLKAFNISILIWATVTGNMWAAGLMLLLNLAFRMVPQQSSICFKEDYCFKIIINCTTILMHPRIYQVHNCKICMLETYQFL
jgi:hypothetical protein